MSFNFLFIRPSIFEGLVQGVTVHVRGEKNTCFGAHTIPQRGLVIIQQICIVSLVQVRPDGSPHYRLRNFKQWKNLQTPHAPKLILVVVVYMSQTTAGRLTQPFLRHSTMQISNKKMLCKISIFRVL